MDLNIKTKNKLDYFIKLVMILSLIEPIKNLRFKERLLLAYLLFYNDKYKELKVNDRRKLVFNKSTRIDISEGMIIDQQTFYNLKSELKKKKIIIDGYLSKTFISLYYKENLNFNYILNGC